MLSTNTSPRSLYVLSDIPGFRECVKEPQQEQQEQQEQPPKTLLKVNKVEYHENPSQYYKVIRYDKTILSYDTTSLFGLCRSVIVNSVNQVVSFSPPKSIKVEDFLSSYEEPISTRLIAEEFVEGTMMNVFWDETTGLNGAWEIATRNSIGGGESSSNSRFRNLFIDALKQCNLDLNQLQKRFCYSFVLQHPENRIVIPVAKPTLYLVEVYEIVNTEDGTVNVFPLDRDIVQKSSEFQATSVQFPERYTDWATLEDLNNKYASLNTNFDMMGVVIRDPTTNNRCKLRNPTYELCKNLKGVDAKRQFKYLSLRRDGRLKSFLEEMPSIYKKDFSRFRTNVHDFTRQLYANYVSCYIRKEKHGSEYPVEYKQHMFELHKQYVNDMKPRGEHVNHATVVQYVNSLEPIRLLYALNAPMRKKQVDIVEQI